MSLSWPSSTSRLPDHPDVLELPGVVPVDVLGEQPLALVQRRPVGVLPDHRTEVRRADLEVAPEVHLVRLDDPEIRILHRPHHPRVNGAAHLQTRCVLDYGV